MTAVTSTGPTSMVGGVFLCRKVVTSSGDVSWGVFVVLSSMGDFVWIIPLAGSFYPRLGEVGYYRALPEDTVGVERVV